MGGGGHASRTPPETTGKTSHAQPETTGEASGAPPETKGAASRHHGEDFRALGPSKTFPVVSNRFQKPPHYFQTVYRQTKPMRFNVVPVETLICFVWEPCKAQRVLLFFWTVARNRKQTKPERQYIGLGPYLSAPVVHESDKILRPPNRTVRLCLY